MIINELEQDTFDFSTKILNKIDKSKFTFGEWCYIERGLRMLDFENFILNRQIEAKSLEEMQEL